MLLERLKKCLEYAILALALINICEVFLLLEFRKPTQLYSYSSQFPILSGYLATGDSWSAQASRCIVLRIANDDCPYCRRDEPLYRALVRQSTVIGCNTIYMDPRGQPSNTAEPALAYVDMNVGRAIVPYVVPQTLVLDGSRLVWFREGMMDDKALSSSIRALRSIP